MRSLRKSILGLFLLFSLVPATFATFAVSVPGPDVWFIYNTFPGAVIEGEVIVQNFDKENPVNVELDGVDAEDWNQYTFHLEPFGAEDNTVGLWVQMAETYVDLGPGESKKVPFTVTIPHDTEFGEYAGGITVSERQLDSDTGGFITVRTRSGIRTYITVDEAPDGASTQPPANGDVQVLFTLENTGLVRTALIIVMVGLLVSTFFNLWYRRQLKESRKPKKKPSRKRKK